MSEGYDIFKVSRHGAIFVSVLCGLDLLINFADPKAMAGFCFVVLCSCLFSDLLFLGLRRVFK